MDDILLEIRRIREDYAKQFGYDLLAIHRDLKQQEQTCGRRIVSLPPRRPKPATVRGERTLTRAGTKKDTAECRTEVSS
jgi:hypothetical protein